MFVFCFQKWKILDLSNGLGCVCELSNFPFWSFYVHLNWAVLLFLCSRHSSSRLLLKLNLNMYYTFKYDIGHLEIQAGPVLYDYDCQTIIIIVKFVYPAGIVFMSLYPYNAVWWTSNSSLSNSTQLERPTHNRCCLNHYRLRISHSKCFAPSYCIFAIGWDSINIVKHFWHFCINGLFTHTNTWCRFDENNSFHAALKFSRSNLIELQSFTA